ncbi:MAG: EamA family transporter, partial [Muribaculaceae bacterium]|nr:EamA family transporter [Muribaculaceae bacterium]
MNKSEKSSRKSFTGYLGGIIAAATFGLNPAFAVPMMREGMDVVSILFFRYLLSLPLMLCVLLIKKRYLLLPAPPIAVAMGAGLLMSLSSITLFESYKYLSVGVAS